ncbi:hypothetical protein GGI25_001712 [Coemansia spiralis]|uniref:Uncharacterized protein n=2 Tax=Coemansia TaxID=4863 RepID=A0A9W8KZ62_9FUNG|nr:hypothetical protein EDC05_003464 [Coemansia umbellata]KAJ2624948.1 hypothetical protein GGI26_001060 [Coemansia sp. RSA 1358]KAJ2679144.1 hypothetical protein GGI25_001712 [Coemansia spiralis]
MKFITTATATVALAMVAAAAPVGNPFGRFDSSETGRDHEHSLGFSGAQEHSWNPSHRPEHSWDHSGHYERSWDVSGAHEHSGDIPQSNGWSCDGFDSDDENHSGHAAGEHSHGDFGSHLASHHRESGSADEYEGRNKGEHDSEHSHEYSRRHGHGHRRHRGRCSSLESLNTPTDPVDYLTVPSISIDASFSAPSIPTDEPAPVPTNGLYSTFDEAQFSSIFGA